MMTGRAADRRQRGFALLIVLWTLALLALLGSEMVAAGRGEAQLARNLVDEAVLEAATDGAVQQAIFGMLQAPAQRWRADGTLHEVRSGSSAVTLRVQNEADKVNPNLAPVALVAALLVQVDTAPATVASLAGAVVAWRTHDRAPGQPAPEAARYAAAGLDYAPPGADFVSIEELGDVLGMTPAVLARLRPHMTVYSARNPDASTADKVVAAALRQSGPAPEAEDGGALVVEITARATGRNHTGFGERVVVRIDPQNATTPFEIRQRERLAQ
jgi:general secretion pathway protein K